MIRSENGWPANDRSVIRSYTIPGTTRKVAIRQGDVATVLLDFLAWFDKNVESIDGGPLDDWGYAERNVRGSATVVSNHASGCAVDINATRHPLGRRGTFSPAQTAKIRAKLKEYDSVLRWGGDYRGRADEMHVEVNADPAKVRVVADRLRHPAPAPAPAPVKKPAAKHAATPTLRPGDTGPAVSELQHMLGLTADGEFGPLTAVAVKRFQKKHHLTADAVVGPATWKALR